MSPVWSRISTSTVITSTTRSLMQQALPIVFVDFDETITKQDTTPLLGQFGLDQQQHNPPLRWSYFVDSYLRDYDRICASIPSRAGSRQRLKALRAAEIASIDRVEKKGVFKGLRRASLQQHGAQLAPSCLREGVFEALKVVPPERLHVISVNWSKDWICGFLRPALPHLSHGQIHSNEFVYGQDNDGTATGKITPHILTSIDKEHQMACILQQHQDTQGDLAPRSIYIGDSIGDLFPLLKADIGIVLGSNHRLLDTIQSEFGVDVNNDGLDTRQSGIYRVDSWRQIHASGVLLAGPAEQSTPAM